MPSPLLAQESPVELIDQYRRALERDDAPEIMAAREELLESETALDYLKANDVDVYQDLLNQDGLKGDRGFLIRADDDYPLERQVRDFPLGERMDNRQIAEDEDIRDRKESQFYSRNLSNRNRPSNREVIEQRKRQLRSRDFSLNAPGHVITISGIADGEAADVMDLLDLEFGQITSIELLEFKRGIADYLLQIDGSFLQLTERFERRAIGPFRLELLRFNERHADFALILD